MVILALSMIAALAAAAPAESSATAPAEQPTAVSGVEVPGQAPQIKVSRREIAIAKKQLKSRGDVVICRRSQVTGSRFPGPPVCKTNRDWNRAANENRNNIDRALGRQWVPDPQRIIEGPRTGPIR